MNILIVGLVNNPQLKRLQQEAQKKGHILTGCHTSQLTIQATNHSFLPTLRGQSLDHFDLIYLWAVSKHRWEWFQAAQFLHQKHHTIIVNHKAIDENYNYFLTPAADYLKQYQAQLPFPDSALVFDAQGARSAIKQFSFPVIVKASSGHQGRLVFKANSIDKVIKVIKDNQDASPSFVLRRFIENDGDIRVFTVGFKAIAAMKRTPRKGDFRSNISQGGSGQRFNLAQHPQVQDIAEKVSRLTRTEIAGIDIILDKNTQQPYILEVNPGPQFTGLEKYTQINAAAKIIEYFESL